MDKEKRKELAAQVAAAFETLQGLTVQATAGNVEALEKVFGLMRYVHGELTAERKEAAADVCGES